MREIKFRYWDGENMIDGDSLAFEEYAPISHLLTRKGTMQYTGLKDKNDKEIYEGDIVICNDESEGIKKRVVCYDIHQTKYKAVPKSTYYANAGNGGWTGFELRWYYEVIGNIYENPELFNA